MDAVLSAVAIYFFLMIVMRISGKRSLGEITTFDFVLLLIVSEATQQALLGEDYSLTTAFLVILTLFGVDIGLSLISDRSPLIAKWTEDAPLVIVDDGKPLMSRMKQERVDVDDVMEAARQLQGLERMDQIKYAVLERNGAISIIPKRAQA